MARVLFNIKWTEKPPSIEQVCTKFGLKPQEIDLQFGVIEIDPENDLYCISVDQTAAQRIQKEWDGDTTTSLEGPFSNPPIAPFGPPIE